MRSIAPRAAGEGSFLLGIVPTRRHPHPSPPPQAGEGAQFRCRRIARATCRPDIVDDHSAGTTSLDDMSRAIPITPQWLIARSPPHSVLALLRNPSMSNTTARMIAEPINMNPPVITASFQGAASCPAAVIGESAEVPSTAADVVTIQLP